ncbi:MAG TPA: YciI family protein [Pyrinomonadaceae bacterium]|nr:YciI family protein [Pyrinomonadaceae bacterium]
MKNRILALAVIFLLAMASLISAQQKEEHKLVQFQMAILKKGPKWATTTEADRTSILKRHLANVIAMLDSGKAIIAGPFGDDTDIAGIFILRAKSVDEAKAWVDDDPSVKAGLFVAEMHPWWSEDIFKKAVMPLKMNTVYLGFLKKGPNRKEGDDKTPEIQELQKAHIANINRLADMKKLVAAGPFGDDGELRGLFVFRVGSMKEAEELAGTDPMIKIDRLRLELHPWSVPDGVLP